MTATSKALDAVHELNASDVDYLTLDGRRYLCAARVTLNGKPAAIGGARNRFATVTALDMSVSAEWAWETVARIVARGGDFAR